MTTKHLTIIHPLLFDGCSDEKKIKIKRRRWSTKTSQNNKAEQLVAAIVAKEDILPEGKRASF
jgi:hypothetical protein